MRTSRGRARHVDASKASVGWAERERSCLSSLADAPIRWICDDAKVFVKRELRRGNRYDAIIMDPPAFGRAPMEMSGRSKTTSCRSSRIATRLSDSPLFFIVNGYGLGFRSLPIAIIWNSLLERHGGRSNPGELTPGNRPATVFFPAASLRDG